MESATKTFAVWWGPVAISLKEAAELVPLSYESLRKVATEGGDDNPFTMICGRWMTTREKLLRWVESREKRQKMHRSESPMRRPSRASRQTHFSAKVAKLEGGGA